MTDNPGNVSGGSIFMSRAVFRAPQRYRQNFGLEPLSFARVAELRVHETLQTIAREFAFALRVEPFQIWNNPFKTGCFTCLFSPRAKNVNSTSSAPVPRSSFCLKSSGKSFHSASMFCATMRRYSLQ